MSDVSMHNLANRCADVGLTRLSQDLRKATTRARMRELAVEAKGAALVQQQAARHFGIVLIGNLAQDLYLEAVGVEKLLNDEEENHCAEEDVRPPGRFNYDEWQAAGCKPPARHVRCLTAKDAA